VTPAAPVGAGLITGGATQAYVGATTGDFSEGLRAGLIVGAATTLSLYTGHAANAEMRKYGTEIRDSGAVEKPSFSRTHHEGH